MREVVITQRKNNCAGIWGRSGVKGFIYRFGVDNINLAYPDDHFEKLYFVFSFEPWYYVHSSDASIDKRENHPDTVLIA